MAGQERMGMWDPKTSMVRHLGQVSRVCVGHQDGEKVALGLTAAP